MLQFKSIFDAKHRRRNGAARQFATALSPVFITPIPDAKPVPGPATLPGQE
jgi:hypothetical protein